MNYLNTTVNWEEFFIQEALELEEKMKTFDQDSLNKSKLRIALENNILEWSKYENWFCSETGCSSFKSNITPSQLEGFVQIAQQTYETFSNHDIWDESLIPLFTWDQQIFVMGLHYPTKLMAIENHVFILAPPHILSFFSQKVLALEIHEMDEKSDSMTKSMLDGIDMSLLAPKIDFSIPHAKEQQEKNAIWEFISERHDEYSFEAKKHFSAYMVLEISQSKTKVFKMDPDLENDGINKFIFEYNLIGENPFHKVFQTGLSESFSLTQLGITIRNYKYACITALQRGNQVVGFLVGFKEAHLSEKDQSLLEDLAKESA
ncbi:MAG: hypothetical protein H7328_01230 [Bdellovibrio sp.]|nr:hypothetical protein [Bdellovibrio sp.]